MGTEAFALDADLTLREGTDPRAPGAEVTVALCGHWEHEGPCRWPHNSRIDDHASPARLRTVIVVPAEEQDDVVGRVETRLRGDERWSVTSFASTPISDDERELADRLARST